MFKYCVLFGRFPRSCTRVYFYTNFTSKVVLSCPNIRSELLHSSVVSRTFTSYNSECADIKSASDLSIKLGVDEELFVKCINTHPSLKYLPSVQWITCFQVLIDNGFSPEDIIYMITKYPSLLYLKTNRINHIIDVWRSSQMGDHYLLSLLKFCPQFLEISPKNISHRLPILKSFGTWKNVVLLLKGAPGIMFEDWNTVNAKIKFLVEEMCVNKNNLVKSFALNRSLLVLKTRFIFLLRCGKYIKPKLGEEINIPLNNISVNRIVSLPDEAFAIKLAGVTLEEFEVFQDLYALEIEIEENEVDDSDSD